MFNNSAECARLAYNEYIFTIVFSNPVIIETNPLFILRSILGYHLHSMCCLCKNMLCSDCMYSKNCAYVYIFETILEKTNETVPGRDKGSHPFLFKSLTQFKTGDSISKYEFSIILLGKSREYFSFIYSAFLRAGRAGFGKTRTPFSIEKISIGGCSENGKKVCKSVEIKQDDSIEVPEEKLIWEYKNSAETKTGEVLVQFLSPVRFKTNGKYGSDFLAQDFMLCLLRRMNTLCTFYGVEEGKFYYDKDKSNLSIIDRHLTWTDYSHYSARQKEAMELGGLVGEFTLTGVFSNLELQLLEFARLFSAGKNTNFGLGQIEYWKKLR